MLMQILEQVLNGLLAGAYYLLIALGLSLIFSLGGLVNLAHGAFYALGAYFAVKLAEHARLRRRARARRRSLVALIGLVVERFLFRRFYREDPALGLLLTFGLAMVAEQSLRWIFGAAPLPFSIPTALHGPGPRRRLHLLEVPAADARGRRRGRGGAVVPAAAHTVRTRGARRRAEPRHGRRTRHLARSPTWRSVVALSVGLAALAGVLLAPISGVHPAMGAEILTAAFVVVVIGGLGSFWGVVLGRADRRRRARAHRLLSARRPPTPRCTC